jgi:hypothetical protein
MRTGGHICLVSATPVFGLHAFENMQRIVYVIGGNAAALDVESWNEGFDALQAALIDSGELPASITILSGDVHYSFTRRSAFRSPAGQAIPPCQLTSSPLHNQAIAMQFSHRDVLVQHGGFIESVERERGRATVVTSINNLALIRFNADGRALTHQLLTRLPDGRLQRLSYRL